jgi:hypothetical protein
MNALVVRLANKKYFEMKQMRLSRPLLQDCDRLQYGSAPNGKIQNNTDIREV